MRQLSLIISAVCIVLPLSRAAQAQLYEWVRTIENPTGSASEFFGDRDSIGFVGDNIIIGARWYDVGDQENAGIAYLFDQEGNLLTTFENPTPESGDEFGRTVLGVGENVIVGAIGDGSGATESGSVYVFDQQGELERTINNPTPGDREWFGRSLAATQEGFVTGAQRDDSTGQDAGIIYRFDFEGNMVGEIHNPSSLGGGSFGTRIATNSDSSGILGVTTYDSIGGNVSVVDLDGNLLYQVERPTGVTLGNFAAAIDFVHPQLIGVANRDGHFEDGSIRGAVYLYGPDGRLSHTFLEPTTDMRGTRFFGFDIAAVDETLIAISALGALTPEGHSGAVYLFDTEGDLRQMLTTPYDSTSSSFGRSIAAFDQLLFVGQNTAVKNGNDGVNAVHLFRQVPEPTSLLLAMIAAVGVFLVRHNPKLKTAILVLVLTLPGHLGLLPREAQAQLYEWVRTIENPTGSDTEFFGDKGSVGVIGDKIVIGAWSHDVGGLDDVGIAYLFDAEGNLLTTLHNPTPEAGDDFGTSVLGMGDKIIVTASGDSSGASESGTIYMFNVQGELLQTIPNPTPGDREWFGRSLAAIEDGFITGALRDDTVGQDAGVVYRFDSEGALVSELYKPPSVSGNLFGARVASYQDKLAVTMNDGQGGNVALLDLDGNLIHEADRPSDASLGNFGADILLLSEELMVIGNASERISEGGVAGAVHLVGSGGEILHTFLEPHSTGKGTPFFGWDVEAIDGELLAISALNSDGGSGITYLVDIDGNLVQLLRTPYEPGSRVFGRSVNAFNDLLFVGEDRAIRDGNKGVNAVHLFKQVPEPTSVLLALIAAVSMFLVRHKPMLRTAVEHGPLGTGP